MRSETLSRLDRLEDHVMPADPVRVVIVGEGEADADAIKAAGLVAGDRMMLVHVVDASGGGQP